MKSLVPEDSPLRNPPQDMPLPQKVALDGVRYSLEMANLSCQRLYEELLQLSESSESTQRGGIDFATIFSDSWSVIDNLWRLNLLLRRLPGVKRTPGFEVHLRAFRSVEYFRHGFQHLDGKLQQCVDQQMPILGTLSWVWFPHGPAHGGKIFLLMPGALRPGSHYFPNPAGKPIVNTIDLVTLSAFGKEIDLFALVRRLPEIAAGLDQGLRVAAKGAPGSGADALISVDFVPDSAQAGAEQL